MGVQGLQIETKYREQREILLNSFWCVCVSARVTSSRAIADL